MGINCEKCVPGFYRPRNVPKDAKDVCRRKCNSIHVTYIDNHTFLYMLIDHYMVPMLLILNDRFHIYDISFQNKEICRTQNC